jgi:hypothetical protein
MLRLGAQQWEIYRRGECKQCQPSPGLRDRFSARHWLQQFKGNALYMGALRHMLSRESSVSGRLDRATDDDIIDLAAQLLGSGLWHVHAPGGVRSASTSGSGEKPPAEPPSDSRSQKPLQSTMPSSATKLSWIEIRLVDGEGKPVPGAAYEVILPDGSIRSGSLNAKGVARYDQIAAGKCEVRFPELDAKEWQPA